MKKLNKYVLVLLTLSFVSCSKNLNKEAKKVTNKNNNSSSTSGIQFKVLQGVIDTSFGNGGYVLHDNAAFGGPTGFDSGDAIKLTPSGDILVCGLSNNGSNHDIAIYKYKPNGIIDDNFGSGGVVTRHNIAGGNEKDYCKDLVVNNDESFYVTGYSYNSAGNDDMVILKYKANGSPDYNFGISGAIYHNYSTGGVLNDIPQRILSNDQDELFIIGGSPNGTDGDIVIWKYFSNGSRDTTFGTDGILNIDSLTGLSNTSIIHDSKILPNGKIVILGYESNGGSSGILSRVHSNGFPDPTFGTSGLIDYATDIGSSKSICHATNDYILYTSYTGGDGNSKLYKMKSNGTLDVSFGTNGSTVIPENPDIRKCLMNDLGDIYMITFDYPNIQIYKVSEDGVIDNTFGDGGIFSYQLASSWIGSNSAVFAKDGSILVTGYTDPIDDGVTNQQMFIIKVD